MIKHEIRTLGSTNPDGSLKYPGYWVFAWVRIGAVWHLGSITKWNGE